MTTEATGESLLSLAAGFVEGDEDSETTIAVLERADMAECGSGLINGFAAPRDDGRAKKNDRPSLNVHDIVRNMIITGNIPRFGMVAREQ